MSNTSDFLSRLFKDLRKFRTALFHYTDSSPEGLVSSARLFILIRKNDREAILKSILSSPFIDDARMECQGNKLILKLKLINTHTFKIELVHKLEYKGISYVNEGNLLEDAIRDQYGIRRVAPEHYFEEILLSFRVRSRSLADEFVDAFQLLGETDRADIFRYMTGKYRTNINVLEDLYRHNTRFSDKILRYIYSRPQNKSWLVLKNRFSSWIDSHITLFKFRGLTKNIRNNGNNIQLTMKGGEFSS